HEAPIVGRIGVSTPILRQINRLCQARRPPCIIRARVIAKTCDKLGIAVWDYLGSRLKVAGNILVQPFDRYVRARFRPA
ncbi:MAG TPA: hypothetical protein VHX39_11870, partial [Acetobacteraceae bacterium]|nr:hypothetical protein [Acetobacteraceae bacterium]